MREAGRRRGAAARAVGEVPPGLVLSEATLERKAKNPPQVIAPRRGVP
jgi:hypothetical protein